MRLLGCRLPFGLTVLAALTVGVGSAAGSVPAPHGVADRAAGPTCRVQVIGVDPDRHIVIRGVENTEVLEERASSEAMRFDVTAMTHVTNSSDDSRHHLYADAIGKHGAPHEIHMTYVDGRHNVDFYAKGYNQEKFSPRLFTGSVDYRVYTVNDAGKLLRYYRTTTGDGKAFRYRKTLAEGFSSLRTLQFSGRFRVNDELRDQFFATTAAGLLKSIVVPLKDPTDVRVRTLVPLGLKDVTALSVGYCNGNPEIQGIVAIDAAGGTAQLIQVREAARPKQANTKIRGNLDPAYDWDLHAVY